MNSSQIFINLIAVHPKKHPRKFKAKPWSFFREVKKEKESVLTIEIVSTQKHTFHSEYQRLENYKTYLIVVIK